MSFPLRLTLNSNGRLPRRRKIKLDDRDDVQPQNDYIIAQKLKYALQMVEAVALWHGYKDGVIVHDDIMQVPLCPVACV